MPLRTRGTVERYTRKTLLEAAKALRKYQTIPEQILWKYLRKKKLHGLKFYRQVPIDRFIADFYCPAKSLILEVDGGVHRETHGREHDAVRDSHLRGKGFRIMRVTNEDVAERMEEIIQKIAEI